MMIRLPTRAPPDGSSSDDPDTYSKGLYLESGKDFLQISNPKSPTLIYIQVMDNNDSARCFNMLWKHFCLNTIWIWLEVLFSTTKNNHFRCFFSDSYGKTQGNCNIDLKK